MQVNTLFACDLSGAINDIYESFGLKYNQHPVKYYVYKQKFTSIYNGSSNAEKQYKCSNIDMIITLLGTNDLIHRHTNSHISPRFKVGGNCVEVIRNKLSNSRDFLLTICDCVIVSHTVGIDIYRFNKYKTDYQREQETVNQAMQLAYQLMLHRLTLRLTVPFKTVLIICANLCRIDQV